MRELFDLKLRMAQRRPALRHRRNEVGKQFRVRSQFSPNYCAFSLIMSVQNCTPSREMGPILTQAEIGSLLRSRNRRH